MKTRDRIDTTDYAALVRQHDTIDPELYDTYQVKRGLRDLNGKGVVAGLTNISRIDAFDAEEKPADGKLWYRGYEIHDLVAKYLRTRHGYENLTYLLLFGEMPDEKQAQDFIDLLGRMRELPTNFTRDVIMKAPTKDVMNSMTRSILTLACYDSNASDTSLEPTTTTRTCSPCTSTDRIRPSPPQRTSCGCCGPIPSTQRPRRWLWMLP